MSFGKPEITEDLIKCEECGKWMAKITPPHLKIHGLTFLEYKKKWGYSNCQPLEAFYIKKLRQGYMKKYDSVENLKKFKREHGNIHDLKKGHDLRQGQERSEQEKIHLRKICVNSTH